MAARGWSLFSLYIYIENLKKSSCQKPLDRFQYNLAGMFLWWPSTKVVQAVMIVKKHGRYGQGYFSLYVYIKNFKNLLVRNRWTKLNVAWQECCFCDPLPGWFKPSWYVKNMASRGQGLFSVYICIENFKMLLVKHLLTNFNNALVTLYQECSSNPDFSKNMPASGWGLFSLYI